MTLTTSALEAIQERDRAFEASFNAGRIEEVAAAYTEDATVLPPDSEPIRGRAAIQQFWQNVRSSGIQAVALHTLSVEAHGNVAAEIGNADLTARNADGQTNSIPAKYVVVWKRQAGHHWQLAIDIWNSRPAGA